MGVDHGERGLSPRFCHVAKFKAPDYLHYNVGKCVFCLYSRTYIKSRHASPQNSSQIYTYAPSRGEGVTA